MTIKDEPRQLVRKQLDVAREKIEHLEAVLDRLEAENARLIAKCDWMQDQIMFAAQAEHARARNRSWGGNAH